MASTADFVNYICEQLEGLGAVRSRKMPDVDTVHHIVQEQDQLRKHQRNRLGNNVFPYLSF